MSEKNKRVCIVFEETDSPKDGFKVYLEGHDMKALRDMPEDKWPRAAFWGVKCFGIVTDILKETGAYRRKASVRS